VERLTGQDAGFLYNETPSQHMHTLKIAVVDFSDAPAPYSFDGFRQVLADRIHLLPALRRRVVWAPLHLAHPWWVEDPDFDLDRHLTRVTAAAPGGREQLDAEASAVASVGLPRDRPLWDLRVVEGLAGGRVAFITKIHHCVADGARAAEMLAAIAGSGPAARPERWDPPELPTRAQLLRQAILDIVRITSGVPALVGRSLRAGIDLVRHRRLGGPKPATPFTGAKTSFNAALTSRRHFATGDLSLDQLKRIKQAHSTTLNDVVLAMVTGALRRHLEERGELPDRPLVAGVPVSTRTGEGEGANRVSNLFVSLPVQEPDPARRLAIIHDSTKGAKAQYDVLGTDMLADWSELTPGRAYSALVGWYSRRNLADRGRPPINLVVSNVPGPRQPLHLAGARIVEIYSMGPILEGIGLNLTVWSYGDRLYAGMVTCPDAMDDVDRLVGRLPAALDELDAALPLSPTSAARAARRPARPGSAASPG